MPPKTRQRQQIADEIGSLVRQRKFIRAKVENIKKFLENFDSETNTINDLKIMKINLEKYVSEIDKINKSLFDLIDEGESDKFCKAVNEFEANVASIQSRLLDFMDQCCSDNCSNKSYGSQDNTIKPFNQGIESSTMIHNYESLSRPIFDCVVPQEPMNTNQNNICLPSSSQFPNRNMNINTLANSVIQNPQNNFNVNNISAQQNCLNSAQQNNSNLNSNSNQLNSNSVSNNVVRTQPAFINMKINAPTLEIPKFDGNPLHWLTFKQMFVSIIHNRPDLDDIVKYSYLLKHLTGRASSGLGHITLTSEGYNFAWQHLINEYDNNCILVDSNIDSLLNLPYCNKENAADLRNLLNKCQLHVSTLSALNFNNNNLSERILINIVKKRLDPTSRKRWEEKQIQNQFSSWNEMILFIQRRCQVLESMEFNKKPFNILKSHDNSKNEKSSKSQSFSTTNSQSDNQSRNLNTNKVASGNNSKSDIKRSSKNNKFSCNFCNKNNHRIYNCLRFLKLSTEEKINQIQGLKCCINCLQTGHSVTECTSTVICKYCNDKHNTLLHINKSNNNSKVNHLSTSIENANSETKVKLCEPSTSSCNSNFKIISSIPPFQNSSTSVLLSTALILISNNKNSFLKCRVLLDSGSQSNFISKKFADKLNLPQLKANNSISLLNHNKTQITHKIRTNIKSRINKFNQNVEFYIVPIITEKFPANNINISRWSIPNNVTLADPLFNISTDIDVLLGADIYYKILNPNNFHTVENQPILLETKFGWIFGGSYNEISTPNLSLLCNFSSTSDFNDDLNVTLPKFWDIPELPVKKFLSAEEQQCEEHFNATHLQDESGRFIVDLPFKSNFNQLGESRFIAEKRFGYLERKLELNGPLKSQYKKFIDEYKNLNHMELVDESLDETSKQHFYLPHHCVLKPSSSTTKLRVVFDASAKTSSGLSLNDVLMVGHVVQDDLFSIVLRFRKHKIAFTTDIKKMYRQILINKNHTPYQRILWRENRDEPLLTYELKTVTYGTASAPYLATRVLNQLAMNESSNFVEASKVALEDFYVDDLLTGSDNLESAVYLHKEIIALLSKAGFELHKWSSNSEELLKFIPEENRELLGKNENSDNDSIKTLGLFWQPKKDIFCFNIEPLTNDNKFTKRSILSNIAKLYDPLGLLSPSIVVAKLLMQNLWKCKISWDEIISLEDKKTWLNFRENLNLLKEIRLNRHVMLDTYERIELHGFADASEVAFGACLYVKTIRNDDVSVMLLCSKSRVAPLKTITVAKLELCAALLLAQLTSKVITALKLDFHHVQLWSDSEIVHAWIKTPPYKLKIFVANRVAEIQSLTEHYSWCHVASADNPADLISRGVMPQNLVNNNMWWNGPLFLRSHCCSYTTNYIDQSNVPLVELKQEYVLNNLNINFLTNKTDDFNILTMYDSYTKLLRIAALMYRFSFNCKPTNKHNRKLSSLTCEELSHANFNIIKVLQNLHFKSEIKKLSENSELLNTSHIKNLAPFLDENNILRVGGRLKNTDYDFNVKHPILLPYNHHYTTLLFRHYHTQNLHAGPNLLVSLIRQNYWPIKAKHIAKKTVHTCVTCFRNKPILASQIMGNLPKDRVTPCIPFNVTGVDFCGPFLIKSHARKPADKKIYVSVFVCFATKAVHLEVVSDLTAAAFISALKRFIARRGKCAKLWSDNATNFHGADNSIKKQFREFLADESYEQINKFLITESIDWNFIPPKAPNFGGLWESSVKSFKTHFKKVTNNSNLNYEEFNTFVIQIEGILNSRPLYPESDDPNDPTVLTPGHFLRGAPLTALPEMSLNDCPSNRLTRWQRVTQLVQLFWKKYSTEYVHHLQTRKKWKLTKNNLKIGDICLIRDDNIIPLHWLLGRVVDVSTGSDSHIRVVKLQTQKGIISRSINNICPLPIEDNF